MDLSTSAYKFSFISLFIVIFFSWAFSIFISAAISTTSLISVFSTFNFWLPLSILASISNFDIRLVIFFDSSSIFSNISLVSSFISRYLSPYWLCELITDIGVLSSCDTSEVNCASLSKEFWSLSNILSKVVARTEISSFPFPMSILFVRSFPSLIFSAVSLIFSIGSKAFFVMRYPPKAETTSKNGNITKNMFIMDSRFFSTPDAGVIPLT